MIPVTIMPQPDDTTCGPTSLHAVYSYFGDTLPLQDVVRGIDYMEDGGTLAVMLGCHALRRGYAVTLFTYNLKLFDPGWFDCPAGVIAEKLKAQLYHKKSQRLHKATEAYLQFLALGGTLRFDALDERLLQHYFDRDIPVLTGLSATYLYRSTREYAGKQKESIADDLRGEPAGHFVVLCGYDAEQHHVVVADPYRGNPISPDRLYSVPVARLIGAIMLGIVTYDANLLIIEPKGE